MAEEKKSEIRKLASRRLYLEESTECKQHLRGEGGGTGRSDAPHGQVEADSREEPRLCQSQEEASGDELLELERVGISEACEGGRKPYVLHQSHRGHYNSPEHHDERNCAVMLVERPARVGAARTPARRAKTLEKNVAGNLGDHITHEEHDQRNRVLVTDEAKVGFEAIDC